MASDFELCRAMANVSWVVSKSFGTLPNLVIDIMSRMCLDNEQSAAQCYNQRRKVHDDNFNDIDMSDSSMLQVLNSQTRYSQ